MQYVGRISHSNKTLIHVHACIYNHMKVDIAHIETEAGLSFASNYPNSCWNPRRKIQPSTYSIYVCLAGQSHHKKGRVWCHAYIHVCDLYYQLCNHACMGCNVMWSLVDGCGWPVMHATVVHMLSVCKATLHCTVSGRSRRSDHSYMVQDAVNKAWKVSHCCKMQRCVEIWLGCTPGCCSGTSHVQACMTPDLSSLCEGLASQTYSTYYSNAHKLHTTSVFLPQAPLAEWPSLPSLLV